MTETHSGTDSVRILNLMVTLYYAEHVHIALGSQVPIPYFCMDQESESDSGNVNEP